MKRTAMKRRPPKTLAADLAWEADVLRRDGRCTFPHDGRNCSCWGKLTAHHIILRRHKATRWDVDNGTALCKVAHTYVHSGEDDKWVRGIGLLARPGDRVVRGRAFPS